MINTVITRTGSCIPEVIVKNSDFSKSKFYLSGAPDIKPIQERISKVTEITGIYERRYAPEDQLASDLGAIALKNTEENLETLDQIIVATNFGDVNPNHRLDRVPSILDNVPSIASRIKKKLGIKNSEIIAYDITYGCPGWLLGVILAHQIIQGGFAKKIAVVGTENLSRVCDRDYENGKMIDHDMNNILTSPPSSR